MHRRINARPTTEALQGCFQPKALRVVLAANLHQDDWHRQVGHDEYHFDANAFAAGRDYIESNRSIVHSSLQAGKPREAQKAFGRLSHAAQDFYAHSNYIILWLACHPGGKWPPPSAIDALHPVLLNSPGLRSGKLYYPLEILSFIPWLRGRILPLLPRDSHAWMNLDGPSQGELFPYAFAAALLRTRHEHEATIAGLPAAQVDLFHGGGDR